MAQDDNIETPEHYWQETLCLEAREIGYRIGKLLNELEETNQLLTFIAERVDTLPMALKSHCDQVLTTENAWLRSIVEVATEE